MRDSLDDLETDLGRLPDVRNNDASEQSPAQQIRRALRGKHVCPFCGTQRETDLGPCMHCSLEDTPTTRSATRGKLGPWYVLQSRNPSAPGMNFATLLVLVHKGRVTARSVIRGPTTGQFWRHAAKVKGLSREFSLCWNCGGDVTRAARACPNCKRLQEPPLNPDVLLESGEFSSEELAEAMWSDQTPPTSQMSVSSQLPSPSPRSGPSSSQMDRLTSRGGVRREVPENGSFVPPRQQPQPQHQSPPLQQRGVLTEGVDQLLPAGLEMAMFQMPQQGGNGRRRSGGGPWRKVFKSLFVAVLLAAAGLAALCSFDDTFRKRVVALGEQALAAARSALASTPAAPAVPGAQQVSRPPGAEYRSPSGRRPITPAPSTTAGAARVDNSAPEVTAGKETSQTPPGGPSLEQAKLQVWTLWQTGVDAERRGDFADAVKSWESIKALPVLEDDLPLGLDARIASAKKRIK